MPSGSLAAMLVLLSPAFLYSWGCGVMRVNPGHAAALAWRLASFSRPRLCLYFSSQGELKTVPKHLIASIWEWLSGWEAVGLDKRVTANFLEKSDFMGEWDPLRRRSCCGSPPVTTGSRSRAILRELLAPGFFRLNGAPNSRVSLRKSITIRRHHYVAVWLICQYACHDV